MQKIEQEHSQPILREEDPPSHVSFSRLMEECSQDAREEDNLNELLPQRTTVPRLLLPCPSSQRMFIRNEDGPVIHIHFSDNRLQGQPEAEEGGGRMQDCDRS
jgi:hypothetical protein